MKKMGVLTFSLLLLTMMIGVLRFITMKEPVSSRIKPEVTTVLQSKPLALEIVRTPSEITQGLSGKTALADDQGMLFVMPNVDRHTFWMKDMNFALDIVFLRNGKVVDLVTLEPPSGLSIPTYQSQSDADMVLELAKGMALKYHLSIGIQTDLAQYR